MSATPFWRRYLRFWGDDPAADVNDEFAFHVQSRIDELVAQGLSQREARDEALRGFGDIDDVKATCTALARGGHRVTRRTEWWTGWRQDVRSAIRQLRLNPMLTAVLVITLALGIGATVSVFSVVNAVLLRPLPYTDGDRIVFVWETWKEDRDGNASIGHFHDWTEQGTVFEATAATQPATYNLSDGEPERLSGMRATSGYFRVFNMPPVVGRYFTEADVDAGARVVVIGYGLWQQRFAGDRSIVGRTITLNGEGHTVVGVAPPEYTMMRSPRLWTPLVFSPEQRADYGSHAWTVTAKLRPRVTREAAQADLERITRGIATRFPTQMEGRSVHVQSAVDVLLAGRFRTGFYVLLGSVALVLLISCVNIANLLLARATIRRREIAIRAAIGGGRWRIVRQLLTESLVLAGAGGVAGLALAYGGIALFVRFGPANVPRLREAGLQPEVLSFALLITMATGLLFGLAPALRAARVDLLTPLRDGGRGAAAGTSRDRVRLSLVVAEIAVAVVLLVGAGLILRSASRLQQVPLGFEVQGSVAARVALPEQRYESDEAVQSAFQRMLDATRAAPGVRRAGASTLLPLDGGTINASMQIEGKPYAPGSATSPTIVLLTDQYAEAVGMSLRYGRTLEAGDLAPGAAPVVLINERLAAIEWPGENPVGKRVSTWTATPGVPEWREVVGVLRDVRTDGPDAPPAPEIFLPFTQAPPLAWTYFQRSMALVARTDGEPAAYAPSLRRAVWSVDSSLPLFEVRTMEEALAAWGANTRFSVWLFSLLAGVGLLLAAVGIYGVIAYFVTQRTPEIGLRLALGASPRSVLLMVLRHGLVLAVTGIAIGLVAALGLTRMVTTLLFEVKPTDAPTYVAGTLGLFAVALLACAIPAMRAVRVDPVRSLAES